MPNVKQRRTVSEDRLTISLGTGQRTALEAIADENNVPLSLLVRCAITEFLNRVEGGQYQFPFILR